MPNHLSILTGRFPHNCSSVSTFAIEPGTATLASILRAERYATGAVTSVFFLDNVRTAEGVFDEFSNVSVDEQRRAAEYTSDEAISMVDRLLSTGKPIFFWLHYYDPHEPYAPPDEYKEKFFTGEIDRCRLDLIIQNRPHETITKVFPEDFPRQLTLQDRQAVVSQYDGEIAYMDHHFGRFVDHLKLTGVFDNAIIAVTSDHGESLFENDDDRLGHNFVYEPVVRIPLIIRHPEIAPRRVPALVQNVDIPPTLLKWIGLEMSSIDGKDLGPTIHNEAPLRDCALFEEQDSSIVGIRSGDYKLRQKVFRLQKTLPVPNHWREQLERLPLIEFTSELKPEWDYVRDKGDVRYLWRPPEDLPASIEGYTWEVMAGKPDEMVIVYGGLKRPEMRFELCRTRRFWNAIAESGPFNVRVTARDKHGNTIAVSQPIVLNLRPTQPSTELFNLVEDPDERDNLFETMPAKVEDLESAMGEFVDEVHAYRERWLEYVLESQGALGRDLVDEETARGLRALGYIR